MFCYVCSWKYTNTSTKDNCFENISRIIIWKNYHLSNHIYDTVKRLNITSYEIWLQLRSRIFPLRGVWSSNTSYQTLISVQKLSSVRRFLPKYKRRWLGVAGTHACTLWKFIQGFVIGADSVRMDIHQLATSSYATLILFGRQSLQLDLNVYDCAVVPICLLFCLKHT